MSPMEMLHEIVAADKAARARTDSAVREKESFDERLSGLGKEVGEGERNRVQKEIDAARARSDVERERRLGELDRQSDERMENMRSRFEAEKNDRVEAMFRMVVGLDD